MAHPQHLRRLHFFAASGGVPSTARFQPPHRPAPVSPHAEIILSLLYGAAPPQNSWNIINGRLPTYQGLSPVEEEVFYHAGMNSDYYNLNRAASGLPSTRSNYGGQAANQYQIHNYGTYNAEWMQIGGYVRQSNDFPYFEAEFGFGLASVGFGIEEDETMILDLDGIEQERENTMMVRDGGLSEEVISKYLKTRNCCEDEEPKLCVVCQDDLRQENQMIGMLDCGHEYHACCIKQWLQKKNICPLCKASAISCR